MPQLRIDFQEGFDHDDVVVHLDGRAEMRRDQVTTRTEVGYAGSLERQVQQGTVEITLEVPTRGLQASRAVDVANDAYVGVSVSGDDLVFVVSPEPMGYL